MVKVYGNKKWIAFFGVAAVLAISAAGCGQTKQEAVTHAETAETDSNNSEGDRDYEGVKIRVADGSSTFRLEIADELGFWDDEFADDGIIVERPLFSDGPSFVDAVASGQADVGLFGDQPLIAGYASGKDVEIIARYSYDPQNFLLVSSPDSDIRDVKDIAGKKVSVQAGTVTHKMLLQLLEKEGLTEKDVEEVYLSQNDAQTALFQGTVDAVLFRGSNGFAAVEEGGTLITDMTPYASDVQIVAASTKFCEAYPELAARFLKVVNKTAEWINENPEEAKKIVMDLRQLSEEQANQLYDSETRTVGYDKKDEEDLNATAEFLYKQGLIQKKVTTDEFVDTQYLKLAGLIE